MFEKSRTLTVSGSALPVLPDGTPALRLSAIKGEEKLSDLYAYELFLTTPQDMPPDAAASIDLKTLAGTELTVTIQLEGMAGGCEV